MVSPGVSLPKTALLKTFLIHFQLRPNKKADGLAVQIRLDNNPGLQPVSVCDILPLREGSIKDSEMLKLNKDSKSQNDHKSSPSFISKWHTWHGNWL